MSLLCMIGSHRWITGTAELKGAARFLTMVCARCGKSFTAVQDERFSYCWLRADGSPRKLRGEISEVLDIAWSIALIYGDVIEVKADGGAL